MSGKIKYGIKIIKDLVFIYVVWFWLLFLNNINIIIELVCYVLMFVYFYILMEC